MNSLEFIEKEIEKEKITIRVNTSLLSQFDNEDDVANNVLLTKIMIAENRLKILEQIKSELEAWEVVKHTIYKRKMGEESFIQVMGGVYNEGQCWTSGINPYETLIKALEVEEK